MASDVQPQAERQEEQQKNVVLSVEQVAFERIAGGDEQRRCGSSAGSTMRRNIQAMLRSKPGVQDQPVVLGRERSELRKRPQKQRGKWRKRRHRGECQVDTEMVLLTLEPYPLVNARGGAVVAHHVGGDVVVREVGVERSPQRAAA